MAVQPVFAATEAQTSVKPTGEKAAEPSRSTWESTNTGATPNTTPFSRMASTRCRMAFLAWFSLLLMVPSGTSSAAAMSAMGISLKYLRVSASRCRSGSSSMISSISSRDCCRSNMKPGRNSSSS